MSEAAVFIVDYDYQADYKVFFVDYDHNEQNASLISPGRHDQFANEAKTVLESNRYKELSSGTFLGNPSPQSIIRQIKELDSYKKHRSAVKLFYGSVSKA